MAMNVGQGFLYDAEDDEFDFAGLTLEILGDVKANVDGAAFDEAVDIPAERANQAGFVKHRRMQQVRSRADILTDLADEFETFADQFGVLGFLSGFTGNAGENRQVHAQDAQHLTGAIVKLTGEAPTFVVLRFEQP